MSFFYVKGSSREYMSSSRPGVEKKVRWKTEIEEKGERDPRVFFMKLGNMPFGKAQVVHVRRITGR